MGIEPVAASRLAGNSSIVPASKTGFGRKQDFLRRSLLVQVRSLDVDLFNKIFVEFFYLIENKETTIFTYL